MLLSDHCEMFGIFNLEDEPHRLPLDTKINPPMTPLWSRAKMCGSVWWAYLLPPCNLQQKFLDV
jgi:hypothetical protein